MTTEDATEKVRSYLASLPPGARKVLKRCEQIFGRERSGFHWASRRHRL